MGTTDSALAKLVLVDHLNVSIINSIGIAQVLLVWESKLENDGKVGKERENGWEWSGIKEI
jgi:hypothetical protein